MISANRSPASNGRTARRATATAAILAATASLLGGCGSADRSSVEFIESARGRAASVVRVSPYSSIEDALPNTVFGYGVRASDTAVVGTITAVEKGVGFVADEEKNPNGSEVSFDHPDAMWKIVELAVDVDEVLAGRVVGGRLRVGYVVNGNVGFDGVRETFMAMDSVVLILDKDSPVTAYKPELLTVDMDGEMFATVGADGQLELPFTEPETAKQFLRNVPDLNALRDHGKRPDHSPSA